MNFEFKCPECGRKITEEDFSTNDKILAGLNKIFDQREHEYKDQISKKLLIEFQESQKVELDKILAIKENEFNKAKQMELDKLNEIISSQKIELSNTQSNLDKIIAEKELTINAMKQKEIDDLKEHISKLNNLIENNKNELDKIIVIKENEFNKAKQIELDKLNEIISSQKIELSNGKANLDKIIAEKESKLMSDQKLLVEKYNSEIKVLTSQINELEIQNAKFKVIQGKTKGENFEHDVFAELLKSFNTDKVSKITSQEKKADFLQEVIDKNQVIGKIVYEVKNAEWSNVWEKKLIEDMAKQNSKFGILIATSFNKKYPGVPFIRSIESPNIFLCNSESFIFVGQIVKMLINTEFKFNSQKNDSDNSEKIEIFNNWKDIQLPKLLKIFEDSFKRIAESESSISKKIDDIRTAREKMQNNALRNIKDFIDSFSM